MTMKRFCMVLVMGMVILAGGCGHARNWMNADWRSEHRAQKRAERLVANQAQYTDRVYGAWYGKFIGLTLGQPVEGDTKQIIEQKARKAGCYPVAAYFPKGFDTPHKGFLLGSFDGVPPNDDTDLMMASLLALREHGVEVTPRAIADSWVKYVPGACTAEAVALLHFRAGVWPPESATVDNPYGTWIGAQMRGEIWGMVAPAHPALAARLAQRDASISHTGEGIYAEQFIAALVSAVMVEKDLHKAIMAALKVIPAESEYARSIRDILYWHKEGKSWEAAWALMDAKYGFNPDGKRDGSFKEERFNTGKVPFCCSNLRWVHATPNGASCVLALLYGEGDFSRSIGLAAMGGYDADCNAGTVGGILGARGGEKAIPAVWKAPMKDIYHSGLKLEKKDLKISEIAGETVRYGNQIVQSNAKGNR